MSYLAAVKPALALPYEPSAANHNAPRAATFDPLEWRIIKSARADRLWTIRPFGRLRRFINWLANTGSIRLANERLEALRKAAVLSWHFGYVVPGDDVTDFLAAGFTTDQYELMVNSISHARAIPPRTVL